VNMDEGGISANDLWIHDEKDATKANILSRFFDDVKKENHLPRPFGVFYSEDRYCYEDVLQQQVNDAIAAKGKGNLNDLLKGKNTWEVK